MVLDIMQSNFIPLSAAACLVVGYVFKKTLIPNRYIPLSLAVTGALIACLSYGISVESIVYGAYSGLFSTGLHQAFKQIIEGKNDNEDK